MTGPGERALRLAREAEGYYELELFEESLARAEEILASGQLREIALAMRAESLRSLERYEEGAAAFEALVADNPRSVGAWVGLGWCRKRSGRLDLAVESMERLLAECPDASIGIYNLACYCALAGERERAFGLLARALRQAPEYRDLARTEEDFAGVRDDPAFRKLTGEETA